MGNKSLVGYLQNHPIGFEGSGRDPRWWHGRRDKDVIDLYLAKLPEKDIQVIYFVPRWLNFFF